MRRLEPLDSVGESPRHRFIHILIDRFVCTEPRLFSVGYPLYLIIIAVHVCAIARNYIIGIFSTSFSTPLDSPWWAFIVMSSFIAGIALMGPAIVPQLDYKEHGVRNIESHLRDLLARITGSRVEFRISAKLILYGLLMVNTMIVAWLWYKSVEDVPLIIALRRVAAGEFSGWIALALDVVQTSLLVLFWNICAVVFVYVVGICLQALSRISHAIELDSEDVNTLALGNVLKGIISSDKPVLQFLKFRERLSYPSKVMSLIMKRLALLIMFITVGIYFVHALWGKISEFTIFSAIMCGAGFLLAIIHIIYALTKWGSAIQTLMLMELKDVKLKASSNNDNSTAKIAEELENVVKEFKHALISSRELWELISALITLGTTIIAVIAGLRLAP